MGRHYNYTSIDRVISKVYRDLGITEVNESDAIEWVGEALEAINSRGIYERVVEYIEVENYSCDLPSEATSIVQVIRDSDYEEEDDEDCVSAIDSLIASADSTDDDSSDDSSDDSEDESTDSDDWYTNYSRDGRVYFILNGDYTPFLGEKYTKRRFNPVRKATHTMFGSSVYEDNSEDDFGACVDEYNIVGDSIKTSFEEGWIVLIYERQRLDEDSCLPLVPDSYSHMTAITKYITMKYMGRMMYLGREGHYANMYMKAEQEWHWYCKQAANEAFMFHGIDEHQNYLENRIGMLPKINSYYGFFGNWGNRRNEKFKKRS